MNYAVAALGLWFALCGRAWPAGLAAAAGVLIHEAFAIYAVPLILASAWSAAGPGGTERIRTTGPPVLCAGTAALAVLVLGGSESAAALQIGTGAYVWKRGLIEIGWGLPWYQAAVLAGYWLILLALLFRTRRANPAGPGLLTLAALCPLALNLFGIDHGRWLTIGFLVVSTALALQVRHFAGRWPQLTGAEKRIGCLLALPLGPHGVTGAWTWIF